MQFIFTHRFAGVLVVALALCVSAGAALARGTQAAIADQPSIESGVPNLVRAGPVESTASATAAVPGEPGFRDVIRSRPVALDFPVLQKVRAAITAGRPQTIRIAFFGDTELPVQITRTERFGSNGTAYIGTVPGIALSSAVMVEENGVVSGNVNVLSQKYQIRYAGAAGHVVQQIDASAFPPDHAAPPVSGTVQSIRRSAKAGTPVVTGIQTALDDGSTVDVMVVYTPSARISEGGTAGMQSRINLIVAETNNAYLNSQVTQRIRLVYAGEVNYTETNLLPDLGRLQNPGDGFIDEVHALRELYGADLVSLWGNYPVIGGCGQSNIMLTEDLNFASQAFTVVDRDCAAKNFSFAHELGHNMGLLHDIADAPGGTTVTPAGSTASTPIDYAHGYVDAANLFRTVMAITSCTNCVRIPYFSNPSVLFGGAPTGNNTDAQEFKALNDTRDSTANFRTSVNLSGPGTIVFSSATYSISENAGSITLSATRHAGATGAVSVHYATINGSAVAGVDYTATIGDLTWADGESGSKTFTVPILQNNASATSPNFTVALDTPTGGAIIGAPGFSTTATVTIIDFQLTGPPVIQSTPPPDGFLNIPYSHTVVASGAMPITYTPITPLPAGLSLNTSNGVIAGIPTSIQSVIFRVIVDNLVLPRDLRDYPITITALPPSPPTITTAIPGDGQASITFTPSISAGSAPTSSPISYTVTCNPGMHASTGLTSPIDVSGLTNGTSYTCGVTATTNYGTADSGTLLVTPMANAAPALVAVKSRKIHGAAGPQLLPIDITAPINGAVSVEPRSGGSAGHTLVFLFNRLIASVGLVTAKDANGNDVGTVSASPVGNTVEVTLAGAPDNMRIAISLTGVNGSVAIFPVSLGFLAGDVNNTRSVNSSDISGVKARSGQTTTTSNFKFDVNASGDIGSSDISAVKARAGLVLP